MKNIYISTVAATVLTFLLSGCSDDTNAIIPDPDPVKVSTISGTVSDGPIENARVFLDLNFDGNYTDGEPVAQTDAKGIYNIDYILEEGIEYLLIAEGSSDFKTRDILDNPDENGTLEFLMFSTIKSGGAKDVNPLTFQTYLRDLNTTLGGLGDVDANISSLMANNDDNLTKLFKETMKGKVNKANYRTQLAKVAQYLSLKNSTVKLQNAFEDVALNQATDKIEFLEDVNESELTNELAYKNQTTPAVIGTLVVSTQLKEVEVEELNISSTTLDVEGVTASKNDTTIGSSSSNVAALARPIHIPITSADDKIKVLIGQKTDAFNTKAGGDITVFITPYDSILKIPKYNKIKDKGYAVIIGADITVKGAKGLKKDVVGEMISGAILEGHSAADLNVTADELTYLYFNGSDWIVGANDGNVSAKYSGELNTQLRLAPYILAKKNSLEAKSVLVEGLDTVKDPVVVAKGHYENSAGGLGRGLFRALAATVDISNIITLDAVIPSGNKADFKIPTGFIIDEVVVLGKDLAKSTAGKSSLKVNVSNGEASIVQEMNLFTNSSLKAQLVSVLGSTASESIIAYKQSLALPFIASSVEATQESTNAEKFAYVLGKNLDNFMNQGEFYDASDINATSIVLDSNVSQKTGLLSIDKVQKTITQKESYFQATQKEYDLTRVYTFAADKLYVTYNVAYANVDINTSAYESSNQNGTVFTNTKTYSRIDSSTLNVTFDKAITQRKVLKYSGGSSSSTIADKRFKGTALMQTSGEIISSNFYHNYERTIDYGESSSPKNYMILNGLVTTKGSNNSFTFDGDFKVTTSGYGDIEGHAVVGDATYSQTGITSANTVVLTTKQSYLANIAKFSTAWLNDKTLYNVFSDTNAGETTHKMLGMSFTDSKMASNGVALNEPTATSFNHDYNITEDGEIAYRDVNDANQTEYVRIISSNNDALTLCWSATPNNTSCTSNEYFYLDQTKAQTAFYKNASVGTFVGAYHSADSSCVDANNTVTVNNSSSWTAGYDSGYATIEGSKITATSYHSGTWGAGTITVNGTDVSMSGTWSEVENGKSCTGTWNAAKPITIIPPQTPAI